MCCNSNGFSVEVEKHDFGEVMTVKVTNAEGAKTVGKPIGNYITLQSDYLRYEGLGARFEIARVLGEQLSRVITVNDFGFFRKSR